MNLQDLKNNRSEIIYILDDIYCIDGEDIKSFMEMMVKFIDFTNCTTIAEFVKEVHDSMWSMRNTKRTGLRETMGAIADRNEDNGKTWNPITRNWD